MGDISLGMKVAGNGADGNSQTLAVHWALGLGARVGLWLDPGSSGCDRCRAQSRRRSLALRRDWGILALRRDWGIFALRRDRGILGLRRDWRILGLR